MDVTCVGFQGKGLPQPTWSKPCSDHLIVNCFQAPPPGKVNGAPKSSLHLPTPIIVSSQLPPSESFASSVIGNFMRSDASELTPDSAQNVTPLNGVTSYAIFLIMVPPPAVPASAVGSLRSAPTP